MSQPDKHSIAIIGAGLAGAAAARSLSLAGMQPVLFDKGRGVGGRLSTRRAKTPSGEVRIDHGAQFLTARTDSFTSHLKDAQTKGLAAPWTGRFVSLDRGGNRVDLNDETRWIGTPGMNGIVKQALEGLDVHLQTRVTALKGAPGDWSLKCEDGSRSGPYQAVILTLPPEQLVELLAWSDGDFSDMIAEAREARMNPCQAVMLVLDEPFDPGFDGAKLLGGGIRWMARMRSRPDRSDIEAWVLHASPDWSDTHLEDDPEVIARWLHEEAFVRFGMPQPAWMQAHRWRYALAAETPGTPYKLDESGTVGCAGDWRLGPRGELAWTSGEALGDALGKALIDQSLS